ncbi:YopX family protein [Salinibacter sp.]|uniref:YopX family protein n=1 Tax=Salinibacter sp. TaxID=2065818 RepID=UPI0021E6E601|nr:YopX family protein [Salinibacter sp.]
MPAPEFRVWDGDEMIYVNDSAVWSLKIEDSSDWTLHRKTRLHCRASPDTSLMQHIGLADAEGAQIFDGDILQDEHGAVAMVRWASDAGGYVLLRENGKPARLSEDNIQNGPWRVAGNLHETPNRIDPDLSRLLNRLREYTGEVQCPMCGGTEFEAGGTPEDRQGPIAVHCVRCHHVMLFHDDVLP